MIKKIIVLLALGLFWINFLQASVLLIPMDETQANHLKAYGIMYWVLEQGWEGDWLLNYRGGSFRTDDISSIREVCVIRGVRYEILNESQNQRMEEEIENENMDIVKLEVAPKIAVYTPPNTMPWDDAVTLALTYAEIPYDKLYDSEILQGRLADYDWLHLHHEDFTGQYGKFYRSYKNAAWYIQEVRTQERIAADLGFSKVSELKLAVAEKIRSYVLDGGFLFAMCAATDSYEIALAAHRTDIVPSVFDGDGIDENFEEKMDFDYTFAFENFSIITDPNIYEFSNIDIPPGYDPYAIDMNTDYFSLFEFSAKWDPVPAMLTQNHESLIRGFMGQTSNFNRELIKKHVLVMGDTPETKRVKYIHGNAGKGTFTYLGGHDPADYRHFVGDPPTNLDLYKNDPGYRLILNNILFPAAKKEKRKT
ncbi:asparagine synthetase B [Fidelibacter multiformis]|uniref:asparagine synthetase B n=1 Tax=Fidelibacter multiformis TaxID=3377529 RepID=UPI0037DD0663